MKILEIIQESIDSQSADSNAEALRYLLDNVRMSPEELSNIAKDLEQVAMDQEDIGAEPVGSTEPVEPVEPQQPVIAEPETEEPGDTEIRPGMKVSQGTVVKVNGNTVVVKTSNGDMMTMNIHDVDQGVAEGSEDDIEDTRQFRDAIALAKSQKAIRQARYGKDQKFYADGTPVTPEEVARRAAERKAKKKGVAEGHEMCPECGGEMYGEEMINEKKDACYYKVKSRYKVWPSAYASGALVKCRNKGAKNWGNKSK